MIGARGAAHLEACESGTATRTAPGDLMIRKATPGDGAALARLAQLDSSPPPRGDHLLAEEDGQLRAALPLGGGRPIADPFHPSADLVAMLELRARRLRPVAAAATPRRGPRGVARPGPAVRRRPRAQAAAAS